MKQVVPKEDRRENSDVLGSKRIEQLVEKINEEIREFLKEGERTRVITEKDLQTRVD